MKNLVTQRTSHVLSALLSYCHRGLEASILDGADVEHLQVPWAPMPSLPLSQSLPVLKLNEFDIQI